MRKKQSIKVAVDIVLFGYESNMLYVLLIKQKYGTYKNKWVLPGGFVKNEEGLFSAAKRELKEEAGLSVKSLEQLYTFGDDLYRDERERVISISYFGTVNPKKMKLKADTDALDAKWFPLKEIEKLPFDHNLIIQTAFERLKSKLFYQPIGFDLLAPTFPFSALENLYMTILEKKIDRRNFRKKILGFDFLVETEEIYQKGSGRPASMFKFDKAKYKKSIKDGIQFQIKFA